MDTPCLFSLQDMILVLLQQSEEMEDIEYPGLPKLGSRVLTKTKQSGTVIKHRKNSEYLTICMLYHLVKRWYILFYF